MSIQRRSGRRIKCSSGQHAGTVLSNQERGIRRILNSCWDLQEVGLGELRQRLLLSDGHSAGQEPGRVLNGPAVVVGLRAKTDASYAEGTDVERQIFSEISPMRQMPRRALG